MSEEAAMDCAEVMESATDNGGASNEAFPAAYDSSDSSGSSSPVTMHEKIIGDTANIHISGGKCSFNESFGRTIRSKGY